MKLESHNKCVLLPGSIYKTLNHKNNLEGKQKRPVSFYSDYNNVSSQCDLFRTIFPDRSRNAERLLE